MTGHHTGHDTGEITVGTAGLPERTDLLVVGLGVTGAGVALDAASRGLDVVAVDAFDLAWGTSRWSSKLVHGGLRYLANLQFDVAHESAARARHPDGDHRPAPDPRPADGDPADPLGQPAGGRGSRGSR